jgi:hypothetical protein
LERVKKPRKLLRALQKPCKVREKLYLVTVEIETTFRGIQLGLRE